MCVVQGVGLVARCESDEREVIIAGREYFLTVRRLGTLASVGGRLLSAIRFVLNEILSAAKNGEVLRLLLLDANGKSRPFSRCSRTKAEESEFVYIRA